MLNNIIAFFIGLITASITLYTHKTNYKILATKDLYHKTFFPLYLIIQNDIVVLNANKKADIKKSQSEIADLKSKFACIIKDSDGAFPNELNFYLQNLSPDNYIYFCRYINDNCKACQKLIGYKPQVTAYGKWRIVRENIIGYTSLISIFFALILIILFFSKSIPSNQFFELLLLDFSLLLFLIFLLERS